MNKEDALMILFMLLLLVIIVYAGINEFSTPSHPGPVQPLEPHMHP